MVHSFLYGDNLYLMSLYPIIDAWGFVQSRQYVLQENGQKSCVRGKATDKPFPYTFVCENRILWGSGAILQIGKVLDTHSALSVSSGLMCLFYLGKLACYITVLLLFRGCLLKTWLGGNWGEGVKTVYSWTRCFYFVKIWLLIIKFVLYVLKVGDDSV